MRAFFIDLPLLILLVSLVYSATRYEAWPDIAVEALRWIFRLLSFLVLIGLGLYVVPLLSVFMLVVVGVASAALALLVSLGVFMWRRPTAVG
jgi:hypothetical protein